LNSWYVKGIGVRWGVKTGICLSVKIGTKKQNFLENLTSAAQFRLIDSILAMAVFAGMTLTLHKSQVHFSGVMQW